VRQLAFSERDEAMAADVIKIAQTLSDEHRRGVTYRPFAAASGIADLADAYAVQREYVRLLLGGNGAGAAGYKIGLTTKRMQAMCNIDSPVAGVVLNDRVHASGATVALANYGHAGLEFEIAVRIGRDLRPNGRTPELAEVTDAIEAVAPAIEIIDDRGADYRELDALSLIADNAWNAGIVLGPFGRPWPDLTSVEAVVSLDGTIVDRGFGREVLGHPFHSVAWLATHLAETGSMLRAGDVVMTGSLVTTKFPDKSSLYRYALTGLGAVELTIRV
jgi:2-keto-4-pentenoate hydratase